MVNDQKHLRGGVVGLGKMGLLHSAIINSLDISTLVAICERKQLINGVFSSFSPEINVYKEYQDMLEKEDLDFVFITTPSFLHIPVAIECVKRGIPFFIEKPLCTTVEEGAPLVDALKKKPITTMVGFMKRYLSTFILAKEIVEKGILGNLITFNATAYVSQLFTTGKGWRYKLNESGGGVFITLAIHAVDIMCWLFDKPRAINARTLAYYSKNVEDFGHAILVWENGLIGRLDTSWSVYNHRMLETTFEIHGENGTLKVNEDEIKLFLQKGNNHYPEGWTIKKTPELFSGVPIDIGGYHFTKQDQAFINAVKYGNVVESDVDNAYMVQQILDCLYKSAESDGQTVLAG